MIHLGWAKLTRILAWAQILDGPGPTLLKVAFVEGNIAFKKGPSSNKNT